MRSSHAIAVLSASTPALALETQLYNFTTYVDIENSALRSNGDILFTTLTNPNFYTINPNAEDPEATIVDTIPGVTALTGISEVAPDVFAVAGGIRGTYNYTNEAIWTVNFTGEAPNSTVITKVATLPNAVMLNGMAPLPQSLHIIVLADSRLGCLWRVDVTTGAVAKAISDPLFNATANASVPVGLDGLKISPDGAYAYFTNVARLILGRVPISDDGTTLTATGDVEVIAELEDDIDDFVFNGTSTIYAAQNPYSVSKIDLTTNELTYVVDATIMSGGPTSLTIAADGETAYVTTRGSTPMSGQIIEVTL